MMLEEDYISNDCKYHVIYKDADSFEVLEKEKIKQHYGICFLGEKIVVCWHGKKKEWTLPGGKIEKGESAEMALIREMREEANVRIKMHGPLGYQEVFSEDGSSVIQLRSWVIGESIADFTFDPDGGITKIEVISPEDWNKYIHWGKVGSHLIERAVKIKNNFL